MSDDSVANRLIAVILGPKPWATRISAALRNAPTAATTRFCPGPEALSAALRSPDVSVVVAYLDQTTPAAPLAAVPRRGAAPPLVICAADGAPAAALLEVMGAGAAALVPDGDEGALIAAVNRAHAAVARSLPTQAPSATVTGTAAHADAALAQLADRVGQPLGLIRDGLVQHLNPAFRALFGLPAGLDPSGRPFADFAAPDSAKPLATLLARAMLLDLERQTRETIIFVPAEGAAFAAEVTASPLASGARPPLAVQLDPTSPRAGIASDADAAPSRRDDRAELLARLAVLTDDASPVERTSVLALASVANYAEQRQRLGFGGAARLMQALEVCLGAAAPAESRLFAVAEDAFAILVEDVSAAEFERVRRRLADAAEESADLALRQIRLQVGVAGVSPGAGAPLDLLDRALSDALPADIETSEPPEITEGLDMLESGYSVDVLSSSSRMPTEAAASNVVVTSTPTHRQESAADEAPPRLALNVTRSAETDVLVDGLMARIQHALESEGFLLALQPIVSLMGDSREHYSVLVRLRRPDGSLADATQIMQTAAGSGRMADIDRWVIRSALRLLSLRRRSGEQAAFFLSLSPELVADDQLLIWICDVLREFDIRGTWVTFQMQDQHAVAQPARWNDLVAGLREIRCRICVNQYGLVEAVTGQNPVVPDFVKFAPGLAVGLSGDRTKQHRLLELIRFVKGRGIRTIVTGVEDSRALNLLWDAGIEYVQGDYLQAASTSLDLPASDARSNTEADVPPERLSLRL